MRLDGSIVFVLVLLFFITCALVWAARYSRQHHRPAPPSSAERSAENRGTTAAGIERSNPRRRRRDR